MLLGVGLFRTMSEIVSNDGGSEEVRFRISKSELDAKNGEGTEGCLKRLLFLDRLGMKRTVYTVETDIGCQRSRKEGCACAVCKISGLRR